jgi:hypothetical protein
LTENGEIVLARDYVTMPVPGGNKIKVVNSQIRNIAFCIAAEPVNRESFYFRGYYLSSDTGDVNEIKVSSSTSSVCSIVDYGWAANDHLVVRLHINPSVDELCIYDTSGTLTASYQGTGFTLLPGTVVPIYAGLRPPGAPQSVPASIFYGEKHVASLEPGERILSNILCTQKSNGQVDVFFITQNDKSGSALCALAINQNDATPTKVQRTRPPVKKIPNFPVWVLRLNEKGIVEAD